MFLRRGRWEEVVDLFNNRPDQAYQNANGWAKRYGKTPREWSACPVELRAWSAEQIGDLMDWMTQYEPRMTGDIVDGVNNAQLRPRVDGLPIVLVAFDVAGERIYGMIDGKHRANQWRHRPGMYAVLIVGP